MEKSNYDRSAYTNRKQSQNLPQNVMTISYAVAQRLQTGLVEEERLKDYDQSWIDKLTEMDRNHTIEQNLDIAEANRMLNNLSSNASKALVTKCPVDKKKIIECYGFMKGDTLKCEPEVKEFINSIDHLLYKATHADENETLDFTCPKKMTYRERFERNCLNK